jgi:hypothetical protein
MTKNKRSNNSNFNPEINNYENSIEKDDLKDG